MAYTWRDSIVSFPKPLPMLDPITLEGQVVRLEPLTSNHLDALCLVGLDPEIWTHNANPLHSREDMTEYVTIALDAFKRGDQLPFVTVLRETDQIIGSTRFAAISLPHRRMEIGWTWITPAWQRTAVNTEAKLLMLEWAFDEKNCNRVEWKTDALNVRSRNAILRLGAKYEGLHRSHMQRHDGSLRDTVYYSVIRDEWPDVQKGLQTRLNRVK